MPPPEFFHAIIANRLTAWLLTAVPVDCFGQGIGLRIPGRAGGLGGRIPDLVVWSKAPANGVWLPVTDVRLVVEIVSAGSVGIDTVTKRNEYAAAGIPQYWVIDQDPAQAVTMHSLDGDSYVVRATMPLAWLLNTDPTGFRPTPGGSLSSANALLLMPFSTGPLRATCGRRPASGRGPGRAAP